MNQLLKLGKLLVVEGKTFSEIPNKVGIWKIRKWKYGNL